MRIHNIIVFYIVYMVLTFFFFFFFFSFGNLWQEFNYYFFFFFSFVSWTFFFLKNVCMSVLGKLKLYCKLVLYIIVKKNKCGGQLVNLSFYIYIYIIYLFFSLSRAFTHVTCARMHTHANTIIWFEGIPLGIFWITTKDCLNLVAFI